jgi:N-acetylgalactosamine PTS system EIIA component
MIGIILTGHGDFASGLNSALELIAGKQEDMEVVDFKGENGTLALEADLNSALFRLSNCEEVVFLTDLAGGSPFKSSVMLSLTQKKEKSFVIAGTNLGMLLEVSMSRDTSSIFELKKLALESGKSSVKVFETKIFDAKIEENGDNEGI